MYTNRKDFALVVEYITILEIHLSLSFLGGTLVSGRMQEMDMLIFLTATCDSELREDVHLRNG